MTDHLPWDIQATRLSELASSTLIVYDHLITFDAEVELIWKAHWSFGKCIFVINRYYTLFTVVVNNYALFHHYLSDSVGVHFLHVQCLLMCNRCLAWFRWQGTSGLIAVTLAQSCLQLRIYALWSLNRIALRSMLFGFISTTAASTVIMGKVLHQISATHISVGPLSICIPFGIRPQEFFTFWIPIITFEVVLFAMVAYRGIQAQISDNSLFRSGQSLLKVLLRDSVVYFVLIFATYLANMIIWIRANSVVAIEIPISWSVAISCVITARIMLNVRSTHRQIAEESFVIQLVPVDKSKGPQSPIHSDGPIVFSDSSSDAHMGIAV